MTVSAFAKLKGVSRNTIYRDLERGRCRKRSDGSMDPDDPLNKMYLSLPAGGGSAKQRAKARTEGHDEADEDPEAQARIAQESRHLAEQIRWKNLQSQKLELDIAQKKGEIAPTKFDREWVGFLASGIRLHFLGLGKRIARGDRDLQDRIDHAVSVALEKTLESAARQTKELATAVARAMEEPEEEPEPEPEPSGEGETAASR